MMLGRLKKLTLFTGDVFLLYLALYLTLSARFQAIPSPAIWQQHLMPFTLLFGVWLLSFYINGLYDVAANKNDVEFYNRLLRIMLVNFALSAGYFYVLTNRIFDIKPQAVFFIFMAISGGLFPVWRFWYNAAVQRPNFLKRVLVVGMSDEARELVEEIIRKPQLGYAITAIIHDGYRDRHNFPGVKIYDTSVDITELIQKLNISTIITALDVRNDPELVKHLFESLTLQTQYFDLTTFYEKLTGKIPVTNIGHIWFLENLGTSEKGFYEVAKKVVDILLAAAILFLSLPVIPTIALLIKFDSVGPILFRQKRVGFLGRPFTAIKFRSMVEDAEKQGGPQWARPNDPRITNFGQFLRATRLDEIPQLLNVLRGEMSIIGPRPERPEFVHDLERDIPFYNERHLVKPGLTGWAQINFQYGASTGDAFKKLQYDLFYIKNRSLALELGIALKTINIILTGKGR